VSSDEGDTPVLEGAAEMLRGLVGLDAVFGGDLPVRLYGAAVPEE